MDGRGQVISRKVVNDRPIRNEWDCECGGTVYAAPSTQYAKCSNGETRCTRCRRVARKVGKRGLTCGPSCTPYAPV